MLRIGLYLVSLWIMVSCVTNKKTQYLQKEDVNPDSVLLNQVVRKYENHSLQYRVQPNDILYINVESLSNPNYNFFDLNPTASNLNITENAAALNGHLVDLSGNIEFPVVDKIKVEGKTLFQIEAAIQEIAKNFVKDPVVNVRIVNFRFTVLGEVNKEGTINTTNYDVSIIEAISLAGGLNQLADRSKVKLIRQINGVSEIRYIDLLQEEFLESPNYYIHQRDVIVVPALKQKPFKTNFGPNLALILAGLTTILLSINIFTQ